MEQDLQAFATQAGEISSAWQIEFADRQEHRETHPCDGGSNGATISFSVEVSKVTFRSDHASIRAGAVGQLSTAGDRFYEVTIATVVPADGFDQVFGEARKRFDYTIDEP